MEAGGEGGLDRAMSDSLFTLGHRQPVGIIGSSEQAPGSAAYETAYQVSRALARAGLAVICGGQSGIMEAACKGARDGGGLGIAVLPVLDPSAANEYATLVLSTDLGKAQDPIAATPRDVSRNRVIASASLCLVAVSGGVGTANEIKHALAFGKTVFGLCGSPPPEVAWDEGSGRYHREDEAAAVVEKILKLAGISS